MIFSDDFNKKRDNYEQSLGNKKDSPNNFFIQVARQATQPLANASPQVSAVSKAVNSNQNNSKNATYMNPLGKSQASNVNGYTAEIPKFSNKYVGTKDTPNQRVQVAGPNRL